MVTVKDDDYNIYIISNLKEISSYFSQSSISVDDVDECAEDPKLCIHLEAGCFNTIGSYKCICQDLKAIDPVYGCDRNYHSKSQDHWFLIWKCPLLLENYAYSFSSMLTDHI